MKRILSALLAMILLFGVLPLTAQAAQSDTAEVGDIRSGTTGDCTWTFDSSTGIVTISGGEYTGGCYEWIGAGAMYNYSNRPPWYEYRSQITSVVVEEGVEEVGSYTFDDLPNLRSISLPGTLLAIRENAFSHCNLTEVIIPNGVKSIYGGAFYGNKSLKELTLDNSVNWIGNAAFYDCDLTELTLPGSLTKVGSYAFNNNSNLKCVTIPPSVTEIGEKAFGYYGSSRKVEGFTVKGVLNSEAELYAYRNGFEFISIDEYCTITFDPNGGSGSMASVTRKCGESYTFPACSFTPPQGKVFDMWQAHNVGGGTFQYDPGETIGVYNDIEVKALWKDAPTVIDSVRVRITEPQAGASPSYAATTVYATGYRVETGYNTGNYKNGVIWTNVTDGAAMTSSSRFETGKRYRVTVMLVTTNPDRYEFADVDQITGVINQDYAQVGSYIDANAKNNIYVTFTFDLDDVIRNISVTVPEPVIGQTPVYSLEYPSGRHYSIDANMTMKWYEDGFTMSKSSKFRSGHEYSVKFTVEAKDGRKFLSEPVVLVNGDSANVENYNESRTWVEYIFPQGGGTVSGTETSYLSDTDTVTVQLLQSDSVKYSTTTTGNTGSYSIPNVANGSYTLRVSKKNHVTRDYAVTVSGNTTKDVKICPIGDADNNGRVNAADAKAAFRHSNDEKPITDPYKFACADVTSPKNRVNSADAKAIFQHANEQKSLWTE